MKTNHCLSRVLTSPLILSFPLLLSLSLYSYGNGFEDLENNLLTSNSRGIEVLNFYQPVEEQNKLRHYIRYEYNDSFKLIEWKLGEGYLYLNNSLDFEYSIEREFYFDREFGSNKRSTNGWDNLVGFVKDTGTKEVFDKEWSTDLGFMWEYAQDSIPSEFGGNFDKTELALRYRIRTNSSLGKGGTFWGVDFWAGKVFVTGDDGYSLEANLLSATNWGYGFQTFSTLYNEYYDWGNFNGTHRLGLESFTRWTHELSERWAFSIEVGVESNKFSGGTTADYDIEVTLSPYLLYNNEIFEDFRIFSEIGLPGYSYNKSKGEFDDTSTSNFSYTLLIGIEYVW